MQALMNRNGAIISTVAAGFLLGSRTIITATGASTYTTPVGCRCIIVELIGGGGGGKTTANSTAGQIIIAGGGAGGQYARSSPNVTSGGVRFNVTVGAGGIAGGAGGPCSFTTSFGYNFVNANGGPAGTNAIASGTAEAFIVPVSGGAAVPISWQNSNGNPSIAAHRVSGTVAINGRGACGPHGGSPVGHKAQVATATAGGNYGGGGDGGISVNAGGASTGGAGGQGICIVWEFY